MILAKAVRLLTGIGALACGSAAGAGPPYITHEGGDSAGVRGTTTIDAGSIVTLSKQWSLLLSGGPVREDGSGRLRAHLYAALGLNI